MRNKRAKIIRKRADILWDDDVEQLTERFGVRKRFYKLCKTMWKKHGLVISRIGVKDGKKLYLFHPR
jgi:hypothetical protein